jgi:hypothetical protein
LVFRRDLSLSRRDDQNLIAIVNMPPRCCADAEIDHVAAEIVRLPFANNRLPRPAHHTATPSRYRRRRIHGFFVKFTNLEYAHLASLCSIAFAVGGMAYAPSPIRHTYTASAESVNRPVNKVNLADLSCGNSFAGISIIVLDYDAAGNLVGIDIDNASRRVDLKKLILNKLPAVIQNNSA